MRVEHTHNNIIDIAFDPNAEGICLLDFVLVEEGKEKFLAQVIEVADDKFDAGLNIARIQIFYKINEKNEIVPYNNFTPTRTCKISVCNQKEIEDYINEGLETIEFSINPKTMLPLKIDADFFNNKPVILADKMDDFNLLTSNLSHILSEYKNAVIFDYTGSLDIEDSARLRASIDFKLPLDFETINSIWEDSMKDATIEVQAVCEDVFNEVKSYLKTLHGKSIPFNVLLKTIIDEYKKEKNSALWYLKNKLVKYFEAQLFAQDISEIELLSLTIKNNKITVIDFSNVDVSWHKAFCEFILRNVQQDVYLFMRINDSTSNMEIVNKLYGKTKIKVIPSVSYGYKKLPSIAENFNNYIFLSTLNPIRNYGVVNPSIWSLDANYALLYGENTKELIFKIQNTTSIDDEIKARKNTKKIPLENFQRQEKVQQNTDNLSLTNHEFEATNRIVVEKSSDDVQTESVGLESDNNFDMADIQKQLNEEHLKEELFSAPDEDYEFADIIEDLNRVEAEEAQQEQMQQEQMQQEQITQEENYTSTEDEPSKEYNEEHLEEEFQNLFDEDQQQEENAPVIEEAPAVKDEDVEFLGDNELDFYENTNVAGVESENINENVIQEENQGYYIESEGDNTYSEEKPADAEEYQENSNEIELIDEPPSEEENEEYYDEQLRAFLEDENETQETQNEQNVPQENYAQTPNSVDVYEIDGFDEDRSHHDEPRFINEKMENLTKVRRSRFKEGEVVTHQKYGIGKILEVIEYSNRTLLQIEFADIGKRLLDPDIANIKHLSDN